MKFLVFEYTRDDYDTECLVEKDVPDYINTRDSIIDWLPTVTGAYPGYKYLIVEAKACNVVMLKEKPIKTFAEWVE